MNNLKILDTLSNSIEVTEFNIRDQVKKYNSVGIFGFENETESKRMVESFPKYIRVFATGLKSDNEINLESFDLHYEKIHTKGDYSPHYMIHAIFLQIKGINSVTGEFNEAGQKRLDGFISGLKSMGIL